MTHNEIAELLWDYRDGTLEPAKAAEAAAHAASCPECRALLAQMDAVSRAAAAQLDRPAGDEFVSRVMARVRVQARKESPVSFMDPLRAVFAGHPARKLALAGGVAAVLAVFALSVRAPEGGQGGHGPYSASAVYQSLAADQRDSQEPYAYGESPALDDGYQQYFLSDIKETKEQQ